MNLYRGGEPTGAQIVSLISRAEWEADANLVRWLRDELAMERTRSSMAVRGLSAEEDRSAALLAECRKLEGELTAVVKAAKECAVDWREQASADENCQRSAGNAMKEALNARGASTYRHCADDLERTISETGSRGAT